MLRLALIAALLLGFEASAHAFWGALFKGVAKVGKSAGSAGKVAGAAKVAKPAAAGAAAGALADDAARGAGKAGGLGDDAARLADDAPPTAAVEAPPAAAEEGGPSLGDAVDVASNAIPIGEEEGSEEDAIAPEDQSVDEGDHGAADGLRFLPGGLTIGLLVVWLLRRRRRPRA